jgi:DNA-binding NarL/FixJ family response regulator
MAHVCCLAGIDPAVVPTFAAVFRAAAAGTQATITRLNVAELRRAAPDLLVCDLDSVDVDALEMLRQMRFVLPDCTIAVFTGIMKRSWGAACHLAGANCLLAKESSERRLTAGVRAAIRSGCYTDPRFAV